MVVGHGGWEQRGFLFNVIVAKRMPGVERMPSVGEPLLLLRNATLRLNFPLHALDGVRTLNFEGNRPTPVQLHKNLHACAELGRI